ncbi:MAG: SCO family protein [Alphaproteobacteria bacterium]
MRRALAAIVGLGLAAASGVAPAHEATATDDAGLALAASQAAIGRVVDDLEFRDGMGARFRLADLRGRPVILSPIYTSCGHTCPLLTATLARAVQAAEDVVGPGRFTVLTVGFDVANDTPARMAAYGRRHGAGFADWRFVTAETAAIAGLLDDIGLVVRPVAGGFDHVAQVTLIDGQGRVVRQVYGDDFQPPAVVDPLLDLVLRGSAQASFVAGLIDRVTLFCTVYDPATGAYRFDYALFVELAVGGLSILAVGGFLWREARRRADSARGA